MCVCTHSKYSLVWKKICVNSGSSLSLNWLLGQSWLCPGGGSWHCDVLNIVLYFAIAGFEFRFWFGVCSSTVVPASSPNVLSFCSSVLLLSVEWGCWVGTSGFSGWWESHLLEFELSNWVQSWGRKRSISSVCLQDSSNMNRTRLGPLLVYTLFLLAPHLHGATSAWPWPFWVPRLWGHTTVPFSSFVFGLEFFKGNFFFLKEKGDRVWQYEKAVYKNVSLN